MDRNEDIRQSTSFQVKKWSLFTLSWLGTIITAIVFISLITDLSDSRVSYMVEILYN